MTSLEITALVIFAPAAEPLVQRLRDKHDPSAPSDMPVHVTLLYPFVPRADVDAGLLEELRLFFAAYPRFAFSLAHTARFPKVLYLAPEPLEPFQKLTRALVAQYPNYPPYGGTYDVDDITPHLTIAYTENSEELDAIEQAFSADAASYLPIHTSAQTVSLMELRAGRWQVHTTFLLGSP